MVSFYSAAAYSKLNQHTFAIEDCRRAIEIDPNYSKAYGRMGLAYANLNNHHLARENYKKALELDPNNDSYASNLKVAEDNIAELEVSFKYYLLSSILSHLIFSNNFFPEDKSIFNHSTKPSNRSSRRRYSSRS